MELAKKYTSLKIAILVMFIYWMTSPVIESQQVIFPMDPNEFLSVNLIDHTVYQENDLKLDWKQQKEFAEAMNQIVLLQGEEAKGTIAYQIIEDGRIDAYEQEVQQYVYVTYQKGLLQRKVGLENHFYADQSFLLYEIQELTRIPFTDRVTSTETVYPHGFEVFTDGSPDREACKKVMALLNKFEQEHAEN